MWSASGFAAGLQLAIFSPVLLFSCERRNARARRSATAAYTRCTANFYVKIHPRIVSRKLAVGDRSHVEGLPGAQLPREPLGQDLGGMRELPGRVRCSFPSIEQTCQTKEPRREDGKRHPQEISEQNYPDVFSSR